MSYVPSVVACMCFSFSPALARNIIAEPTPSAGACPDHHHRYYHPFHLQHHFSIMYHYQRAIVATSRKLPAVGKEAIANTLVIRCRTNPRR
uniref:Putative secreted protein n=1 Tax=Anopheles darlingi TaxID=43151 RepID=A0A2M4DKK7_ANODA